MAERPIIFSAPMVRAILAGRKTVTRCVVKPQPFLDSSGHWAVPNKRGLRSLVSRTRNSSGDVVQEAYASAAELIASEIRCPYGVPGDTLWVKEAWAHYHTVNSIRHVDGRAFSEVSDGLSAYRSDGHDSIDDLRKHIVLMNGSDLEAIEVRGNRWRSPIQMPRWASRIDLRVLSVRVERLHEIDDADARREGIVDGGCWNCGNPEPCGCAQPIPVPRDAFIALWESIHGPYSWHGNPWVWRVEFKRVEAGK